ncbi:hypothetical protein [Arthrobacter sp. zg-Y877]|uniref:hypothetical protein n=1 Tax=Arthrobacter sp. zg-Y877 TaxID=3049074 RepID=UPI0025A483A2|nr:hypothetical protein [Arthrobacter sp. zg-Y877]MDM7990751.1 hypothetical protein [Arthrobacter sp. zg-Y877]
MDNTTHSPYPPSGEPSSDGQPFPADPGMAGPGAGGPGQTNFGKPAGNPDAGKGLAITALVIGVVSLLLCWIPFVNNLVFVLGLIGLGFAIPALIISVKNRSRSKGMSIAALILVVLSLVGVLATQAFYGKVIDDTVESIEDGADGVVESSEEEKEASSGEEAALGTAAEVGDYSVTVSAVNTNAGDVIAAVNPYNAAPQGQYVLVDLAVQYSGDGEGNPWIDLQTKFIGADARQYDPSTCTVALEKETYDVPTLEKGGVAEYQVCMDVPAEALADAKIFVEPTFTLDNDDRAYWAAQ